jgi:ABC-type glycerol-3-phosphate transport system substrate-binding protein
MVLMKIRGLIAAVLVSVALGACTRSATAPEAPETSVTTPSFTGGTPPPPDTVAANRGGGSMGTGH